MDETTKRAILKARRNEITEARIYEKLARSMKDRHNRDILSQIAEDEKRHEVFWREYADGEVKPNAIRMWWYYLIAKVLGLTFGIKLMERGEQQAQVLYEMIAESLAPAGDFVREIVQDEDKHERQLIDMINEERLKYVGSMVLGLNDALVELTGALAGLTLALGNTRLIAMAGLITGLAASLSMAASEYLSIKSEGGEQNPIKASTYTGIAYVFTVMFLILPYLIFTNLYVCLGLTIANAILVIFLFTFYISVAQGISLKNRFFEMGGISLGVAILSFGIGFLVRVFLHVEA